ncbi:MAG: hypothetical protein R3251_04650 [Candidatus Spechtbacterales bacterium]|nr:hypothetical protein [Candidatus Spechtbacterales bacterium]
MKTVATEKVESFEDIIPGGRYYIKRDDNKDIDPYGGKIFTVVSESFPAINDRNNERQPHVAVVFDSCEEKDNLRHICQIIPVLRFGVLYEGAPKSKVLEDGSYFIGVLPSRNIAYKITQTQPELFE